ncbi:MAG: tetratricopeptide repeat protein [Chthoniobacteraceae bacterium]
MRQIIRLSLIVLATGLRPLLSPAAEPAELKQGIAAAGAGNLDAAAALLAKAVAQESDEARWLLARLHGTGKMKGASLTKARELLEAAAQAGYGPAAYDLARLAEAGALSAGKPDKDQTVFYFKGAAESGLAVAQYRMGNYAATGEAGARDEKAALEWFKKAAEQKHPPSMLAAARLMDAKAATVLVKAAAEIGYAPAMNDFGVRLLKGVGVEKDEKGAAVWLKKAAATGLPAAQLNMGVLEKDSAGKASGTAAAVGHPVGLFLAADGAEKSGKVAEAFALFSRAAESSHEEAGKRRDALKAKLSPAQMKEAEAQIAAAAKAAPPVDAGPDYAAPPVPNAAFAAIFPRDDAERLAGAIALDGPAVPPQFRVEGSGFGAVKASAGKATTQNW